MKVVQGPGFSWLRFFRAQVQGSGPNYRTGPGFLGSGFRIQLPLLETAKKKKKINESYLTWKEKTRQENGICVNLENNATL